MQLPPDRFALLTRLRRGSCLLALATTLASGCLRVPKDLTAAPSASAAAPKTAAELLDRYIAALGGKEALTATKVRTVEARMVLAPDPGCTDPEAQGCLADETIGSFLLQSTSDGRMYRRSVLRDVVEERGFDGKTGWTLRGETLLLDAEADLAVAREDALLHWYLEPEKRGVQLSLAPSREAEIEGQKTTLDGLVWQAKGDVPAKTMWFDRATGLLAEETVETAEKQDKEAPASSQRVRYLDYHTIDGLKAPFRVVVRSEVGPEAREFELSTQRISHAPIPGEPFAVPELPSPPPSQDARLQAFRQAERDFAAAPRDPKTAVLVARTAFAAAAFEQAAAAAKKTLELDPKEPEALLLLLKVHVLLGQFTEAEAVAKRAEHAGLKPAIIALQRAAIASRRKNFAEFAQQLDLAGDPVRAGRFRSFAGKPVQAEIAGKACSTKVPITLSQWIPVVPVQIHGKATYAVLDSGAGEVVISDALANDLAIISQGKAPAGPGSPEVPYGQLQDLAIGDARLDRVPVDIFPAQGIADMAGPGQPRVEVVLGARALSAFQLTLDPKGPTLELVRADKACKKALAAARSGEGVPFVVHESHYIFVEAQLNAAPGLFLVNTGMRGVALTATRQAFAHAGIGAPVVRAGQPSLVRVGRVSLRGGPQLDNVLAAYGYFEQDQTADGFRTDGLLGLEVLASRRVTIDYETQRLYFGPTP